MSYLVRYGTPQSRRVLTVVGVREEREQADTGGQLRPPRQPVSHSAPHSPHVRTSEGSHLRWFAPQRVCISEGLHLRGLAPQRGGTPEGLHLRGLAPQRARTSEGSLLRGSDSVQSCNEELEVCTAEVACWWNKQIHGVFQWTRNEEGKKFDMSVRSF